MTAARTSLQRRRLTLLLAFAANAISTAQAAVVVEIGTDGPKGVVAKLKSSQGSRSRVSLRAGSSSVGIAENDGQASLHVPSSSLASTGTSYVFLQKFPLEDTDDLIFHTEVLVCPRVNFSDNDQKFLDDHVASLQDFVEIDESWWSTKTNSCTELGYGGDSCTERCCAVPHGPEETAFPLNEHRAVISNAKVEEKSLYLYGSGEWIGDGAYHCTCDKKCWSNWAGTDYNPLTNNCNTFTSTVLKCVFGLSEKKPDLGVSDLVTVKCADKECVPSADEIFNTKSAPMSVV